MEAIKKAVFGSYDQPQDTTNDSTQNNNTMPDSHKEEPISGVQGDTSKGEPFDAGNMSPQPTSAEASNLHDNKEATTSDSNVSPPSNAATAAPSSTIPEPTTESNLAAHKEPSTSMQTDSSSTIPEPTTESNLTAHKEPSTSMQTDPSSTIPEPTTESNLTAHKEPSTSMQTDPSSTKKVTQDHPAATDDNDEPQPDISGPGPRPISQVAAEHGGHMPEPESASARTSTSTSDSDSKKSGGEKSGGGKSGGDKYVSSGFAATGGNFDAAHPGAGQEALRLMHEPGQHKTFDEVKEERHHHHHHQLHLPGHNGNAHSGEHAQPQAESTKNGDVQTADQGGSGKAKLGEKIEKIKNKLHIRSKDKESASATP